MTDVGDFFDDMAFAELYDHFNPWAACDDFYLAEAFASGGPVLDIGCGTGLLACRIAAGGVAVVGEEPAAGMLQVARTRPGTERVAWVESDGQSLRLGQMFDFIYMTGHAFQALLTDADAVAVLKSAALHLSPNGRFVFETRNPALAAWRNWTPDLTTEAMTTEGRVQCFHSATYDPANGIVAITHCYRYLDQGRERIGHSRIRFIDYDHLAGLIAQAGLEMTACYGDWDRRPYGPDCKEIIAVTGLPSSP